MISSTFAQRIVLLALSAILTLHGSTLAGPAPAQGLSSLPSGRPVVMGYINGLRDANGANQSLTAAQIPSEIQSIHWDGYDVIVHAFAEPVDSNGSIGESLGNFSAYQASILTEAHARKKSVILSIGGAFPTRLETQFFNITTDPTKRANFISNVVSYMKTKGYDGVDIDWEFPNATTGKAALTLLMTDLYAAVKAENSDYMVMFGTGPAYFMGGYDFTALKDHSDFFFYFGYDWKNATPSGANGPMKQPGSGVQYTTAGDTLYEQSVRGGIQYVIDKGYPADQIICGLPFYGSDNTSWSTVRNTWAANIAGYDAAIDANAMEVQINGEWFTTPVAMKMKMSALLDSSSSVLNNSAIIRGVGTWEIGHEHKSNPDLSKAFEEWIADFTGAPSLPSLSIADASIAEGDSGSSDLTFTVTLNAASASAVTVDYASASATATAGSDFTSTSGTLTFAAGETSKSFNVSISGDKTLESDETFTITLSNVSATATISNTTATGTITDDDATEVNGTDAWTRHYQSGSSDFSVSYVEPSGAGLWSTGFLGVIQVTNNSSAIGTWTMTFDAPWTTTGSGNAGTWTITDGSHSVIQPSWAGANYFGNGQTINIGFTGSGTWSEPTNFKFNGVDLGAGNPNNTQINDWKTTHSITDLLADSDGNGLDDIVDFIVGNNPSTGSTKTHILTATLEPLTVNSVSSNYFCIHLDIDTLAEGVEYRIEVSDDLDDWTTGSNVMIQHATSLNPDGSTHAVWRSANPVTSPNKKFSRLVAREVATSAP